MTYYYKEYDRDEVNARCYEDSVYASPRKCSHLIWRWFSALKRARCDTTVWTCWCCWRRRCSCRRRCLPCCPFSGSREVYLLKHDCNKAPRQSTTSREWMNLTVSLQKPPKFLYWCPEILVSGGKPICNSRCG